MKKHALPPPPVLDFDITLDLEDSSAPAPPRESRATEFFGSLEAALAALAPQGASVLSIGFDPERIARCGYRLADCDADITAVRGGIIECAEARRRLACGKLLIQPTEDFGGAAAQSYLARDGAFFSVRQGIRPHAAVFDEASPPSCLAAAFGEIAAFDLCAFDYSFGQMLRGDRVRSDVTKNAAAIIEQAVAALKGREKNCSHAAGVITAAARRVAESVRDCPGLRFCSGATQTAVALDMLTAAESRKACLRGEAEMLLSTYIAELYMKNICAPPSLFPPDFNRRTECVCKYFGGDPIRACAYAAKVLPPTELKLREYRCREFREEYVRALAALRTRQNAAFAVFKRLYPDDGFRLSELIDPVDIGICAAVAPDVLPADTALSHFKNIGLLEKYLV